MQSGNSLQMWEEFFPNAEVYGIDIDPECKKLESGRKNISIGDQSDEVFLKGVVSDAGGYFDIIIDDGSHVPLHQLSSFNYLFPYLSQHGIYVIEDTGGCTGDFQLYVVNSLKQLIGSIMYWPDGVSAGEWPYLKDLGSSAKRVDKKIIGIDFYRWLVFVMKGDNPGDNKYLLDRNN